MRYTAGSMAVLAALVLLAGCRNETAPPKDVRPVQTLVASPTATTLAATYSGTVTARNESDQGFRVAGTVLRRLVEVGDHVEADQGLIELDPASLDLQLQAAKAQLDAARSKAAQAKVNLQRDAELLRQEFISQAEYDRSKVDYDASMSQMEMARAQYDEAGNQSGYGTLRAAVPGVVTDIKVDVGQVVNAGGLAVTIARDGDREVVVSVPESRVDQLRAGRDLTVTLWASPDKQYQARLRRIDPNTDTATRTYAAHVTILDPDPALLLGMTAYVHLPETLETGTFTVPLTAVVDKPEGSFVWVVDGQTSTASLRAVKVVSAQGDSAQIGEGLAQGDVVVTAGASFLHPGQKVLAVGTYGTED